MKICFIVEYYPPHIGGGEVLFENLASGLAVYGHQVFVITCRDCGAPAKEIKNGVFIRRIWSPGFLDRVWFTFLCLVRAYKIAKKSDIIHTTTYNGALAAFFVARLAKKPTVLTAHEVLGKKWFKLGLPRLKAFLCRLAESMVLACSFDAYSCNSKNTMTALHKQGVNKGKTFLSYPGIDYDLFTPANSNRQIRKNLKIPDSDFVCLCYGRPGILKGMEYLMQAVPEVCKAIDEFCLVLIISEKPAKGYKKIMNMAKALGEDRVRIIKPVCANNLPDYIMASDCVVVPSISEGFGYCAAEACAMGKPLVTTWAGALPEVASGKFIIVPPKDSRALAQGIIKAFNGQYKTSPQKKFLISSTVDKHLEVYKRLHNSD